MNNNSKKLLIILIILFLSLGIIGFTMSYFSSTTLFDNDFFVVKYETSSREVFTSPENWLPGDTTPKTITTKNEGNIDVRVRVSYTEEWISSNGDTLPNEVNGESIAIINLANTDKWKHVANYYYYMETLEPNEETLTFMESVTFNPNVEINLNCVTTTNNDTKTKTCTSTGDGYDNATYRLTVLVETISAAQADNVWDYYEGTLYGAVRNEYRNKTTFVQLYQGEHKDSFDKEATEEIYNYYLPDGIVVESEKNYVYFADRCWKVLRTTDTGGVKMIYRFKSKNGLCLGSSVENINYISQNDMTNIYLDATYVYGSDYTYDLEEGVFKVAGTIINDNYSTNKNVIGMYTCKSENIDTSCETLYFIYEYRSKTDARVIPFTIVKNGSISGIGNISYNYYNNSLAYVGYMYNKVYNFSTTTKNFMQYYDDTQYTLTTIGKAAANYYYSNEVSYNSNTNQYTIENFSATSSMGDLVGKYTFFESSSGVHTKSYVYYVAGVTSASKMYGVSLRDGDVLSNYSPIIFGSSVTDNGNGTFTLDNTISSSYVDYFRDYNNYVGMYTCGNSNITCSDLKLVISSELTRFKYISNPKDIIVLAKTKSGLNLTNTTSVTIEYMINNYSNLSDYKYTCNNNSTTCTTNNIRIINSYTSNGYLYTPNILYGSDVTWDGTKYRVNNPIDMDMSISQNNLSTHHYFCSSPGETECSTVNYLYYYTASNDLMYYMELSNGVESIDELINEMLYADNVNSKDSIVKAFIEEWYYNNLMDYDDYFEETIYCNDRSIYNKGGWKEDGGLPNEHLQFKSVDDNISLSCENETDQFSVSNIKAKLKYKVGLASEDELRLIQRATNGIGHTWTISPGNVVQDFAYGYKIDYHGDHALIHTLYLESIKKNDIISPTVSLKPDVKITGGTGFANNPYVIETN